ncbi:MAG: hypothetical protein IKB79_07555, partial [Oscillospiraceae bacterium]|nr:hypothetical protein [Oscillospiraceae bacterium]
RELSLDDGATFIPAVPEKKVLFYGDSITQGMDCLHPNAKGFDYYFRGLWPQMKATLKERCL